MSVDTVSFTVGKAKRGIAVKQRTLLHGKTIKSDPTLTESFWRLARVDLDAAVDLLVRFLRRLAPRKDLVTLNGLPAPGVSPNQWVRRLSAESHGSERTLIEQDIGFIPFDIDDALSPQGSALDRGENLYGAAEFAREMFLPPCFRDVDMAVSAASSTGLKEGRLSLHAYVVLDRSVPMPGAYQYVAGAKAAGFPLDPRPLLPGQLFLTGRPIFSGLDDPVPEHLRAFVLPGRRQRATSIDWNEFSAPLAIVTERERNAHIVGAGLGWRAVLDRYLGDSGDGLGFFRPLSVALGYAARSDEPVDEIAGAMHAILAAHPDLTADRAGQYTIVWLRRELQRLRAKDTARAAHIDAEINAVRGRLSRLGLQL